MLAKKLKLECVPNLYLFGCLIEHFIKKCDQTDFNALTKEERTQIVAACNEAQTLGERLSDLLSNNITPSIEGALNAKRKLLAEIEEGRQACVAARNEIYEKYLINNGKFLFDFEAHLSKEEIIAEHKYLFNKIIHEGTSGLDFGDYRPQIEEFLFSHYYKTRPVLFMVDGLDNVVSKIVGLGLDTVMRVDRPYGPTFTEIFTKQKAVLSREYPEYLHIFRGYKDDMSAKSPSLNAKILWLTHGKLDDAPTEGKLRTSIDTSFWAQGIKEMQLLARVFFCNKDKGLKWQLNMMSVEGVTFKETGNFFNKRSIIDLTYKIDYTELQPYTVQAADNSLFQLEHWQKIPPPLKDEKEYGYRLQMLLIDYELFLNRLFASLPIDADNLFAKKLQSAKTEYILASRKWPRAFIPLVFPKSFIDYWKSQCLPDDFLESKGVFHPFYEFVHLPGEKKYQLQVQFCYILEGGKEKEYGSVVAAEVDQKTVDSFKKIEFSDDDYQIGEANINECLFQMMYADLLRKAGGGMPDKKSCYLKGEEYVAPHETAFVGIYNLLDASPSYHLTFDSSRYDFMSCIGLMNFMMTGSQDVAESFIAPSSFEHGTDYDEVNDRLQEGALRKKTSPTMKTYAKHYHLLYALTRLTSSLSPNKVEKTMNDWLALTPPDNLHAIIEEPLRSGKAQFIRFCSQNTSLQRQRHENQMSDLARIAEDIGDTLPGKEKL
jgi:hypothetical protein